MSIGASMGADSVGADSVGADSGTSSEGESPELGMPPEVTALHCEELLSE